MGINPRLKNGALRLVEPVGARPIHISMRMAKIYKGRRYEGRSFLDIGEEFIFNNLFDEPWEFQGEMIEFIGDERLGAEVSIFKREK